MEKKETSKEEKEIERILIIEDDLPNLVSAYNAFSEMVKEGKAKIDNAVSYESFLEKLDKFKPTIVLSDARIPIKVGEDPTDLREEIAKELEKRGIKYIFVTLAPTPENYHKKNVYIIRKKNNVYEEVKRFYTREKDTEIWKEAYEILKKSEEND